MDLTNYLKIKEMLGPNITLVAVSKGQPIDKIMSLYELGHRDFGENFLQELDQKRQQLPNDIKWHFLGNIQSNKLSKIVRSSFMIHSVSRKKIYDQLINLDRKETTRILLQLKLGHEKTKSGFSEEDAFSIVRNHNESSKIKIKGLMAISENNVQNVEILNQFKSAHKFFKSLQSLTNQIDTLSMGMSNDYEMAILCKSNLIRLGTIIFGDRS